MKNRIGIIILILICVGLGIGLIWSRKTATEQRDVDYDRIGSLSNQVVNTRTDLEKQRQVNTELERHFNDLAVLREQVAKLKEELNISRRLEWIRKGLFASDNQKGAEHLMRSAARSITNTPSTPEKQPVYDLNVEVKSDGTVRVIPPATNAPAATNAQPAQ
jgi:uncharacterized membrane-anchored protein YhcB (DUF1043 family)